jgi:RHS repeat-associated protein
MAGAPVASSRRRGWRFSLVAVWTVVAPALLAVPTATAVAGSDASAAAPGARPQVLPLVAQPQRPSATKLVAPPPPSHPSPPTATLHRNPVVAAPPPWATQVAGQRNVGFADAGAAVLDAGSVPDDVVQIVSTPVPTVTGLSPETGTAAGGTTVTVTGSNFVSGGTGVSFGSVPAAAVTYVSTTQLTVTTPPMPAGQVQVTVTTSAGTSATGTASAFLFVAPGPYTPVTATRICDTRAGTGTQCSGHTLAPFSSLAVPVVATGVVPSNASAVLVNVTAVGATANTWVGVYPDGLAVPQPGSALNPNTGVVVANLVQVPLGSDGAIALFNENGSVDLIVDVQGYVSGVAGGQSTAPAGELKLVSPPARICDTRSACSGNGALGPAATLTVQATGVGGVPSTGVQAVVINLQAVPLGTGTGVLTVWPAGAARPSASNLNFQGGVTVTNRVVVPVSTSGQISIYDSGPESANIIVDVFGYTMTASGSGGSNFDIQSVARACDTRTGSGYACAGQHLVAGVTDAINVAGLAGLPPAGSLAVVALNVTIVPTSGSSWVTVWPDGSARPSVTDVYVESNVAIADFDVAVGVGSNGKIDVYTPNMSADVIVDVEGYYTSFVPLPTVTKTLVGGTNGMLKGKGESVQWQVVVQNPTSASMSVDGLTDAMDTSLLHDGPPQVNGASCTAAGVTCSTADGYVTVSPFTLAAGASLTLTYFTAVGGKDRQCAGLNNTAVVSIGNHVGPVQSSPLSVTACDAGLGLEDWWSYVTRQVDPTSTASVNVANGNLVLQSTDSTPIQSHGRFDFVLRRTYNSEDSSVGVPHSLGYGWQFNVGDIGDAAGSGPGMGGSLGLLVPNSETPKAPIPITFVDRDGTRQVFKFRGLDVNGADVTDANNANGILHSLHPLVLGLSASYTNLCVDETFSAPPGVHLSLYRYIEVAAPGTTNPCGNAGVTSASGVTLGFEAVRPDRTRYEFSYDGHMLAMLDAAGNKLTYNWANNPSAQAPNKQGLGALQSITDSAGRGYSFSTSTGETDVTDPAGRVTRYLFDALSPQHLVQVVNPDGSSVSYGYGGCGGTADQLCTITDQPRNTTFRVSYTTSSVSGGGSLPGYYPYVASLTDRDGNATSLTYSTSPDWVSADEGNHRVLYQSIDASGRVGEIDDGTAAAQAGSVNASHQTFSTWDTSAQNCRTPADTVVDNDLCQLRRSGGGATPDETTTFTYNPEGLLVHRRQSVDGTSTVDTTYGYHTQFFEPSPSDPTTGAATAPTVHCWEDQVAGGGAVNAVAVATNGCTSATFRSDAVTLYYISDATQVLTPRGNAAGTGYGAYLTTYLVDDNSGAALASTPGGVAAAVCSTPSSPVSNTGLVCETDGPSADGSGNATVTRSTYDGYGQKTSMTTPKSIAETPSGTTPPAYRYVYFQDSDKDLSVHTSAGGWLKGVVDPTGAFVAFAYDAAGDPVRTWDRDATRGLLLANFPGSINNPTATAYHERLYGSGSTTAPYASPWRYPLSDRDPLGNTVTYTVDADGNRTKIRPARGNSGSGSSAYDITQGFDGNDHLVCTLLPVESGGTAACAAFYTGSSTLSMTPTLPARASISVYDSFGNRTLTEDSEGGYVSHVYDGVDRLTSTLTARGPSTMAGVSNCRASTSSDAPMPTGQLVCSTSTSYDMEDNVVQSQDGAGQVTSYKYDGLHRRLLTTTPRNNNSLTSVYSGAAYDADGNVTDVCPPRQYSEGGSSTASPCVGTGTFSTRNAYDVAGRLQSSTQHRDWTLPDGSGPTTLTTSYSRDADGNVISTTDDGGYITRDTFNLLDRRTSEQVPRDKNVTYNTTQWQYDPAGDVTAQIRCTAATQSATPCTGLVISASTYDADLRPVDSVDGATNADATTIVAATGGSDVRTRVVYDPDGHVIGRYAPGAFAIPASAPDAHFLLRTDFDADGRPVAQYTPRYDGGTYGDTGIAGAQTAQCPASAPAGVWGLPSYPTGVGVCTTKVEYDVDTNPLTNAQRATVRLHLPTTTSTDSNPYLVYNYTEDHLLSTVTGPTPPGGGTPARETIHTVTQDADGRVVSDADASSITTSTAYTSDGLVAQVTRSASSTGVTHVTTYQYDANGEQTSVTDGANRTTTTTRSSDGRDTRQVDGATDTTLDYYDEPNRKETLYTPSAWIADATNPAIGTTGHGQPVVMTYTGEWLLSTQKTPVTISGGAVTLQREVDYGYDEAGRKNQETTSTIAGGTSTTIGSETFLHYPDSRLQKETGRDGTSTISWQYDPAGKPTSITDSLSGRTLSATYYLDELPRTVDDTARTQKYGFDGAGSVAARQDVVDGGSTSYTTSYTYADSGDLGSMVSAAENGGTTTWDYDAAGKVRHQTAPNGLVTTWTYDSGDATLQQLTYGSSSTVAGGWCYTDNGAFQIASEAFAVGTSPCTGNKYSYGYDGAGRLNSFTPGTSATAISITHDHDGNRLTYTDPASGTASTFTYRADDSIATQAAGGTTKTYSYDGYGQLSSDGTHQFCYDAFGRTTTATQSLPYTCGSAVPATASTYTYDGLDRQITHRDPSAGSATAVHYDGLSSTAALEDIPTKAETLYALTPNGTHAGLMYAGSATSVQYLVQNGTQDVSVVDASSPTAPTCGERYDPFGTQESAGTLAACTPTTGTSPSTGNTPNSIYYRESRRDPGSGDYQYGSRTYDPTKSSFLTPDAYRTSGGNADAGLTQDPLSADRYNYVNGDPVNLVDPNGHGVECTLGPDCQEMQATPAGGGESGSVASQIAAQHAPGYSGKPSQRAYHSTEAQHRVPVAKMPNRILPKLMLLCVERRSSSDPCSQVWADTPGAHNYCDTYLKYQTGPDAGTCSVLGTLNTDMAPDSQRFRYFAACVQATMAGKDCTYSEDVSVVDLLLFGLTLTTDGGGELVNAIVDTGRAAEAIGGAASTARDFGELLETAQAGTLTAREAREVDLAAMRLLSARSEELVGSGATPYLRARILFAGRTALRAAARNAMADRGAAEFLDTVKPNMSWDQVVAKYHSLGYGGDDLWNAISEAALRSNNAVNQLFGLSQ